MRVNFGNIDPKEIHVILKRIRDDETLNVSETAKNLISELIAPYEPDDMITISSDGKIRRPQGKDLSEFDANLGTHYIQKYCGYLLPKFFTIDSTLGVPAYTGVEPETVESLGVSTTITSGLMDNHLVKPPTEAYGCPAENNARSVNDKNHEILDIGVPNATTLPEKLDRLILDSGLIDTTTVPAGYFTAEIEHPRERYHKIKHPTVKVDGQAAEYFDQPVDSLNIKFDGPMLSVVTGHTIDADTGEKTFFTRDHPFNGVGNISLGHIVMAGQYQFGLRTWESIRPGDSNPANPNNPTPQTVKIQLDERGSVINEFDRIYYMYGGGRDGNKDIRFNIGVPSLEVDEDGMSAQLKFIDDIDPFLRSTKWPGTYGIYVNNLWNIPECPERDDDGNLPPCFNFHPDGLGDHFAHSKPRPDTEGVFHTGIPLTSGVTLTDSNLVSWDTVSHTDIHMNMYYVHEREFAPYGYIPQEDATRPYVSTGGPNYVIGNRNLPGQRGVTNSDIYGGEGGVGKYFYPHCFTMGGTPNRDKGRTNLYRKFIVEIMNFGDTPNAGHASFNLDIKGGLGGKIVDVTNLTDLSVTNGSTDMTTGFLSGRGNFLRRALHPAQIRVAGLGNCFNSHTMRSDLIGIDGTRVAGKILGGDYTMNNQFDELHCIEDISMCYIGMPVHGPFVPDGAEIVQIGIYEAANFPDSLKSYFDAGIRVAGFIKVGVRLEDVVTTPDVDESTLFRPPTTFYLNLHGNPDDPKRDDFGQPVNTVTIPYYDNIFFTDINGTRGGDGFRRLDDGHVSLDCILRSNRPSWTDSKIIVVAFNFPEKDNYKDTTVAVNGPEDIPRYFPLLDGAAAGGVRIIDHDVTPFYKKYTENQIDFLRVFYENIVSFNPYLGSATGPQNNYEHPFYGMDNASILRECSKPGYGSFGPDITGRSGYGYYGGGYNGFYACRDALDQNLFPAVRMHQQCSVDFMAYMNGVKPDRFFPEWTVQVPRGSDAGASDVWYIARPAHRADYITRTGLDNPYTKLYGLNFKSNNMPWLRHDAALPESPYNPMLKYWPYDTRAYKTVLRSDKMYVPKAYVEGDPNELIPTDDEPLPVVDLRTVSVTDLGNDTDRVTAQILITNRAYAPLKNWQATLYLDGWIEDHVRDVEDVNIVSASPNSDSPRDLNPNGTTSPYVINGAGFTEDIRGQGTVSFFITFVRVVSTPAAVGPFTFMPPEDNFTGDFREQSYYIRPEDITGTYGDELDTITKPYNEALTHPYGTDPLNNSTLREQGGSSHTNFLPDQRIQNNYPFNYPYYDACTGFYKAPAGYAQLLVTVEGDLKQLLRPELFVDLNSLEYYERIKRQCFGTPFVSRDVTSTISPSASIFLDNRHINKIRPQGLTHTSDSVPQGTITLEHGPSDTCYKYDSLITEGGFVDNSRLDTGLPTAFGKNALLIKTSLKGIRPNDIHLGGVNPCFGATLQGEHNWRRTNSIDTENWQISEEGGIERKGGGFSPPLGFTQRHLGEPLQTHSPGPYCVREGVLGDPYHDLPVGWSLLIADSCSDNDPYHCCANCRCTIFSRSHGFQTFSRLGFKYFGGNVDDDARYIDTFFGGAIPTDSAFFADVSVTASQPKLGCDIRNIYPEWYVPDGEQAAYGADGGPGGFNLDLGAGFVMLGSSFLLKTDGPSQSSYGCCQRPANKPCPTIRIHAGSQGGCCETSSTDAQNTIEINITGGCVESTSYGGNYILSASCTVACSNALIVAAAERDVSEGGGLYFPEEYIDYTLGSNNAVLLEHPDIAILDPDELEPVEFAEYRAKENRWRNNCGCTASFSVDNIAFSCPSTAGGALTVAMAGEGGSAVVSIDYEKLFFQAHPNIRHYKAALARGHVTQEGIVTALGVEEASYLYDGMEGNQYFDQCDTDLGAGNYCRRDEYDGTYPPVPGRGVTVAGGPGRGYPITKGCRGSCYLPTPQSYIDNPSNHVDSEADNDRGDQTFPPTSSTPQLTPEQTPTTTPTDDDPSTPSSSTHPNLPAEPIVSPTFTPYVDFSTGITVGGRIRQHLGSEFDSPERADLPVGLEVDGSTVTMFGVGTPDFMVQITIFPNTQPEMGSQTHDITARTIIEDDSSWQIVFNDVPQGGYRFNVQLLQLLVGGYRTSRNGFSSRISDFQADGTPNTETQPAFFTV